MTFTQGPSVINTCFILLWSYLFPQICGSAHSECFAKVAKNVFYLVKIVELFVFLTLFGSASSDIFSKYWKVLVSNNFKICGSASSATEDEAALSLAQVSSSRKLEVKQGLTQFWRWE